jgi:hypothetical protein
MTTAALRPFPGATAVFREQLRLVWDRDRWQMLALWGCLFMFAPSGYWSWVPFLSFFALFLAGIWAEFIWRSESQVGRSYHLAMPLSKPVHHLLRVSAGLVWLMVLFLAAVLPDHLFHITTFPTMKDARLAVMPGWLVVAWPLALMTTYLLVSSLVIATRRPALWVAAILGVLFLILPGISVLQLWGQAGLFDRVIYGTGMAAALMPNYWLQYTYPIQVYGHLGPFDPANLYPGLLWFGAAVALLLVAVHRNREA